MECSCSTTRLQARDPPLERCRPRTGNKEKSGSYFRSCRMTGGGDLMIILTAGRAWDPRSPGKSVTLDLEKPQPGLGALPSPGLRA